MRYMISAIQIVIDKNFPVTVDVITMTRKVVQLTQSQWSDAIDQSAQKLCQRGRIRIQIHKYKLLPHIHLHRNQPIVLAFEVLHPIELRHPLKGSIQSVIPSVIWTMQN